MRGAPRIVVTGTHSGAGKTTIATGLMAAFAGRGESVAPFKVGPDFIDPSYHALATGRPGRNLDAFLSGERLIGPLFKHGSEDADIAVIEGVMGLFDGRSGAGDFASTAHVAKLLDAPTLLVVDAGAMARSAAAMVHGYASFDPEVRLAGVILNRVGSDTHERMLREAIEPLGIPVVGVMRRGKEISTPDRHLGLVPVAERRREAAGMVERLGEVVARSCDLEAIARLARSAGKLAGEPWSPGIAAEHRAHEPVRVAVAVGPAFSFLYEENIELLRASGAEVAFFDPTTDEALPEGADALYLGGGFPEAHAEALAANESMKREARSFAGSGRPVIAECGGLLYLCRDLDGTPMCGVIGASARMANRLTLGYREATAAADSPIMRAGNTMRGHEFHYSMVEPESGGEEAAWELEGRGREGFVAGDSGNVHASYLHTHWAAAPEVPSRLVEAAVKYRESGGRESGVGASSTRSSSILSLPRPTNPRRTRPEASAVGASPPGFSRLPTPEASGSRLPASGSELIGVGVGPGDPEMLTLKGLRALEEAAVVFVPVGDAGEVGRAEAVVRAHVDEGKVRRLVFALSADEAAVVRNHREAARIVAEALRSGADCAFATIGDPNVYSTFTYLARRVRGEVPEVKIRTVPGITAMQDLASRSGTALVEGAERLVLLPFVGEAGLLRDALSSGETVVCYKGGGRMPEVARIAKEAGRLEGAVYGARLGSGGEKVGPLEEVDGRLPYLSTVIFNGKGREFDG